MTGEQPKQPPTFGAKSITWVQTELLSTLIAMLLDKRLISIDEAETIFAVVDKKLADHPSPDAPEAREFLNWLHQRYPWEAWRDSAKRENPPTQN